MSVSRSLPVIVPRVSDQRWSCHSCGDCCRSLVVHLTAHDRDTIDAQEWSSEIEEKPYVRLGRGWVLNKRADGACVFLDAENRCRIHSKHGAQAKPLACRVYPFSLRRARDGWQASLRFDCPSVLMSNGDSLTSHRKPLGTIAAELTGKHLAVERPVFWQRGVRATRKELDALDRNILKWLARKELTMRTRLIGVVRLTTTLFEAKLKRVRGERCIELVNLLFGALTVEAARPIEPASFRQSAFLRQIALAHSEHLTFHDARRGLVSRFARRISQLRKARAFRLGEGVVPSVPGLGGITTFERVNGARPAANSRDEIENLILRYVTARIESRSVYGDGYYGWPVVSGYAALWLSLAAASWLARMHAAINGRHELEFVDVAGALAIVDRAATRLPALGTFVERSRVAYLVRDEGIARLLNQYAITRDQESE